MDDILCETARSLCAVAKRLFGSTICYDQIQDFNLQTSFRLTSAQLQELMEAAHSTDFLLSYAPTPGAVEGLKTLRAAGHEVDVVTGRPASSHCGTEGWLKAAGLGDFPITYANKYGRLFVADGDAPEMVPLLEIMRRSYDVIIDDSPVVLPAFAALANTKVLVFDRPWNRKFVLRQNMTRVRDWAEVLREICPSSTAKSTA